MCFKQHGAKFHFGLAEKWPIASMEFMGAMRGKEAKSTTYGSVELEYGVAQRDIPGILLAGDDEARRASKQAAG